MKSLRLGIAAAACAALAACGSPVTGTPSAAPGGAGTASTPAGASTGAPSGGATATPSAPSRTVDEAAVETAFRSYYQALLTRDWPTACGLAAPATVARLLENLRTQGGITVATCEEAYTAIYANAAAAAAADGIARTAEIQKIEVAGENATITWSASYNGQHPVVTNKLVRSDGKWLLLDTGS